jgi:hypothetical protein
LHVQEKYWWVVVFMTFTLLLFWGGGVSVYAQEPEKERLIDRFSFRTNAVDWLLTIPNVSVSFDLFPGEYNKMDVLLGVRYNWNTFHKLPTYYVFDVFDARAEYRYHFRFEQLGSGEKPNFFSLKHGVPGLSNYIFDDSVQLASILHKDVLPGVDFIPGGHIPPNPAELLGRARFDTLIQELKEEY